jgi:spoIIIJ-associated protein
MDPDEQKKVLEDFLTELAASFGLEATAASTLEDNELTVNLSGDQLGLLVGPRLATLDAVQEIARNALQRQAAGREYAKVVVDVERIRARRRESLTAFVTDAARQVVDEDVDVVFEVMSSVDRKQVHDVAADLDGVTSASEGEDPRRRVVLRKA